MTIPITDTEHQALVITDLLNEVMRYRRAINDSLALLRDVPHAIDHDRMAVAGEFVDRAVTTLSRVVGS